jgi:hypothetical protein
MEQMILPAMARGGYGFRRKVNIGLRLGAGRHIVDGLAEKDGRRILVSLKWQQVPGTTEQKVPFEVISMIEALGSGGFNAAYVVLGGQNWRFKDFYLNRGLENYISEASRVHLIALEDFVARANQGRL